MIVAIGIGLLLGIPTLGVIRLLAWWEERRVSARRQVLER
jgi:hypothetical protein